MRRPCGRSSSRRLGLTQALQLAWLQRSRLQGWRGVRMEAPLLSQRGLHPLAEALRRAAAPRALAGAAAGAAGADAVQTGAGCTDRVKVHGWCLEPGVRPAVGALRAAVLTESAVSAAD